MLTAFAILGVLAALFLAAVLATRDSEGLAPAHPDVADLALPEGPLHADDVRGLRFGLGLRGYRMSEVDAVLERLAGDLDARDRRIAELESAPEQAPEGPVVEPTVAEEPAVVAPAMVEPAAVALPVAESPVIEHPVTEHPATEASPVATPTVQPAPDLPPAPSTDAAFSAADDLDFPEVSLPDLDEDDADTPAGPHLSLGEAPVEPVDPPVRSSP